MARNANVSSRVEPDFKAKLEARAEGLKVSLSDYVNGLLILCVETFEAEEQEPNKAENNIA